MLVRSFKKITAFLLLFSTFVGALSPNIVLAATSVTINSGYSYSKETVTNLYGKGFMSSNLANVAKNKYVGKVTNTNSTTDDIPGFTRDYLSKRPTNFWENPNNESLNSTQDSSLGSLSSEDDCKASNADKVTWTGASGTTDTKPLVSCDADKVIKDALAVWDSSNAASLTASVFDVDKTLLDLDKKQGGFDADLSNLNQRFASALYHHMKYTQTFYNSASGSPTIKWNSLAEIDNADYAELLNSTLSINHEESLTNLFKRIGVLSNSSVNQTDRELYGLYRSSDYAYSLYFLGVLAKDSSISSVYDIKNPSNTVCIANTTAAYCCLKEYCDFYLDNMVSIANTTNWEADDAAKASLFYMKNFHDAFGGVVPVIEMIYHRANPDADNMSIYDMVMKIEDSIKDMTFSDAINMIGDTYVKHTDVTSPVTLFYTCNSDTGIISYDRDAVLGDVEVDKSLDASYADRDDEQYNDSSVTGMEQNTVSNEFLTSTAGAASILLNKLLSNGKDTTPDSSLSIPDLFKTESSSSANDYMTDTVVYDVTEDGRKSIEKHFAKWKVYNKEALYQYVTHGDSGLKKKKDKNTTPDPDTEDEKSDLQLSEEVVLQYGNANTQVLIDALVTWWENTNGREQPNNLKDREGLFNFLSSPDVLARLYEISQRSYKSILVANKAVVDTLQQELVNGKDIVVDFGVNEDGDSNSYMSVTINDFIVQGMGFSANYVPMQTNMYDANLIKSYQGDDGDNSFYNTYLTYGFLRKALLKDTSATSAQDFFNANGTLTGTLKTATLRDLIELGDKDLALYLDSNFYNADIVKRDGVKLLDELKENNKKLYDTLSTYASIYNMASSIKKDPATALQLTKDTPLASEAGKCVNDDGTKFDFDNFKKLTSAKVKKTSNFNLNDTDFPDADTLMEYLDNRYQAYLASELCELNDVTLKTNGYTSYSNDTRALLSDCDSSDYINLGTEDEKGKSLTKYFHIDPKDDSYNTVNNFDTLVLPSYNINKYMAGDVTYSNKKVNEDEQTETTNTYTVMNTYTPMMGYAYVSLLYRDIENYTLANTVESNNPVFLASKYLCGSEYANQWYRNTLLNYMLVRNLPGNAQLDVRYVTDLDCPIYMDIFGNIITESGTVVIPAACNATLHTAAYKNYNYASGLYSCYGKTWSVPTSLKGANSVLHPFFLPDSNSGNYVINGYEVSADGQAIRFDKINMYDDATLEALRKSYMSFISSGTTSRLNWMVMVKIVNEVMRGAPIENIDKDKEGLATAGISGSNAGLVAAAKLESLLESLHGKFTNTLLCIPDFSRTDDLEYWVALLIKLLMVATAGVVIIAIYRDGVSGQLGLKTFAMSLLSIALVVVSIVGIPTVFQLTYYTANKMLLQNEAFRILMANEEKRIGGTEIGVTKIDTVESTGEFAIQLDWITVPWYEELEQMLYNSTLENLQEVKMNAYKESPVYENKDVTVHNDGVYVTTDDLFDSVTIDFPVNATSDTRDFRLVDTGTGQTASWYTPYYVFLQSLVSNINEYNSWQGTSGKKFLSSDAATEYAEDNNVPINSYNYTIKNMATNRPMPVGASKAYFESEYFMQSDEDILRLNQIYCANSLERYLNPEANTEAEETTDDKSADVEWYADNTNSEHYVAQDFIAQQESHRTRSMTFSDDNRLQFRQSYWFNHNLVYTDMEYYTKLMAQTDRGADDPYVDAAEEANAYVNERLKDYYKKVESMDNFCRDFVAKNKDMLGKVTDETFIKVMALAMSVKYNQLFGIPSADALEIYNMDSEDLVRLCIVPADEAIMASTMSYPRFAYTFGGEATVYLAAVLAIILWLGSFIKPLCTVIIFCVVFISIFVFRVVMRKESANLWGYLVTILLLCVTNFAHALILKLGVSLPNFGLPPMACLFFMIVMQVIYLLILAYVTGVSMKDWENIGANEYKKEAKALMRKQKADSSGDLLRGNIKHHENNWDYYNDLVDQHRKRNVR